MPGCRLSKVGNVEEGELGNARINRSNAGDCLNAVDNRLRRSIDNSKNISKSMPLIVGIAALLKRSIRADSHQKRRHPAGNDERNGKRLSPKATQFTKQFSIKDTHALTN